MIGFFWSEEQPGLHGLCSFTWLTKTQHVGGPTRPNGGFTGLMVLKKKHISGQREAAKARIARLVLEVRERAELCDPRQAAEPALDATRRSGTESAGWVWVGAMGEAEMNEPKNSLKYGT